MGEKDSFTRTIFSLKNSKPQKLDTLQLFETTMVLFSVPSGVLDTSQPEVSGDRSYGLGMFTGGDVASSGKRNQGTVKE